MADLDQNPSHQHILQKLRQRETLMTTTEVAALLRFSEDTIYRLVDKGDIPTLLIAKARRFDPIMLANWLQDRNGLKGKRAASWLWP